MATVLEWDALACSDNNSNPIFGHLRCFETRYDKDDNKVYFCQWSTG